MTGKRIVKNGQIAPHTKDLSYMDYLSEKRKIEDAIETTTQKIPHAPLFCTPNCQHKHFHNNQYDYSKNYTDPYEERPGVDFLCDVKKTPLAGLDLKNVVGETGCKQTPINLDTGLEISNFKDDEFRFNYEKINPAKATKFNEAGDAFFFKMNDNDLAEKDQESWLETKTVSLFDNHIYKSSLYGM